MRAALLWLGLLLGCRDRSPQRATYFTLGKFELIQKRFVELCPKYVVAPASERSTSLPKNAMRLWCSVATLDPEVPFTVEIGMEKPAVAEGIDAPGGEWIAGDGIGALGVFTIYIDRSGPANATTRADYIVLIDAFVVPYLDDRLADEFWRAAAHSSAPVPVFDSIDGAISLRSWSGEVLSLISVSRRSQR